MRLLNALLAIGYAGLGLAVGWILVLADANACEGNSCVEAGSWIDTGQGWQWDVIAYAGLASMPAVILAVVFTYVRWRLGAVLIAAHLALLAVALPFAGRVPNWTYPFVLIWYAIVASCALAFLWTRNATSARSFGGLGTPASPSA